jgi:hypothetical protein
MGFLQALTSEPLSYSSGNYPQAVGDQAHLVQEDSPPSQAALHPEPEHGPEAVHLLFGKAVLGVIRQTKMAHPGAMPNDPQGDH